MFPISLSLYVQTSLKNNLKLQGPKKKKQKQKLPPIAMQHIFKAEQNNKEKKVRTAIKIGKTGSE